MELEPGAKLGQYEIVSAIGRGGMGEVWKARDLRLIRDVAGKTSRVGFSGRFQKEVT
jgi:serine/threonine protein kinase